MSKKIKIELFDDCYVRDFVDDRPYPTLYREEYPHIYLNSEVNAEELAHAIDTIATFFMQNDKNALTVDLDEREKFLKPPVEMTIKEIEKELGYKVKIVGEEVYKK